MQQIYGNILWTDKPRNFLGMALNFTRYILTDKKLVVRRGFFTIKEEKIDLYKILDLSIALPLGQRIFKCGTITLNSKDVSTPVLKIEKVKDPYTIYNLLEETSDSQKKELGVMGKDIYVPPVVVEEIDRK